MIFVLTFFLTAILIVLIAIYFVIGKQNKDDEIIEPKSFAELNVLDAAVGDSITIHGAGDNFQDLNFTVDRRDRYESGGEQWFEVSGRYMGRRVFVEVSEDDDIEVLVNLANTEISLSDLGLTEEDLVSVDETHDSSMTFSYNNSVWQFEWSGEIGYFKGGGAEGEGYYNWDFAEKGGSRKISVEKWEDEPFEVILSRKVNPDDVQIFRS